MSLHDTDQLPRRTVLRGLATVVGLAALPFAPRLARSQVFAAENLTVTPGAPFIVSPGTAPVTLNFGSVTIQRGAAMTFYAPVNLTTQTLVRQ